jgi:hypothetical protein
LLSEKGERASAPNPAGTPFVDEAGVFFDEAGVFFDEAGVFFDEAGVFFDDARVFFDDARVFFDDLAAIVLLRFAVRAGRWVSQR